MVACAVSGCSTNSRFNEELSIHRIPSDYRKDSWLKFCQRPDLMDKSKQQLKNYFVCSLHFEPCMFKNRGTRQSLCGSAVPTLNGPGEDGLSGDDNIEMKTEQEEAYSIVEQVDVKQEIEDAFSEHEEDIEQQLENRKRQMDNAVPAIDVKRIKVEENEKPIIKVVARPEIPPEIPIVPAVPMEPVVNLAVPPKVQQVYIPPKVMVEVNRDNDVFPVDFMRTVLNSQHEILSVLKNQVLLENPDRELLTFLRLVGVKLSRFHQEEMRKMQDAILNLINER